MNVLSSSKFLLKKILYGGKNFFCPVCETSLRKFYPAGIPPRPNAKCPACGSVERHRMIWLYLTEKTDLFSPRSKKILHVAPEPFLTKKLTRYEQINYLSADLFRSAMVKMDITDIQYPDRSFDVIYCSHVLEHIPEDRRAMQELARVLSPDGWAILQVPIDAEKTFEDPSITDPAERERLFGQPDHVRVYGPDYKERLEEAGFIVNVINYLDAIDAETRFRYGLGVDRDDIYFCRRNSP